MDEKTLKYMSTIETFVTKLLKLFRVHCTKMDEEESYYPDTSQDLKDQIKMATMECSKGIIPNQLAMLGTNMPE